jgi:hypothetical protein
MPRLKLATASLCVAFLLPPLPALHAQAGKDAPAAPLPSQILTARNVFLSNAGGLLDLNTVSGDPRRDYNQFYAAVKDWGRFNLVASPAEADLVLQISITSIPRQIGGEIVPFPAFKLTLIDPKTSIVLWALDEFLVDRPGISLILKKNRDKIFDTAIGKLVDDLKSLTAPSPGIAQ